MKENFRLDCKKSFQKSIKSIFTEKETIYKKNSYIEHIKGIERIMAVSTENNEEINLESRLLTISSILHRGKVEGTVVIDHEVKDDLFIKDFITRNTSVLPEINFVANRIKIARATLPTE
jgi:hypothetical protein